MRRCRADLHIHTALSPCADREMTPGRIVRAARERGLAMIAICDHNSAGNVQAVMEAAGHGPEGEPTVIAGIEITTREEVHVLGLFPEAQSALRVAAAVLQTLPYGRATGPVSGRPARTGNLPATAAGDSAQLLLDRCDRLLGSEPRFLAAASGYDLAAAVALIRENDGLAVAAHLDRRAFSVLGQLGFMPPEASFDAAEVSAAGVARSRQDGLRALGLPLVSGSDGHFLEDIGTGSTLLEVEAPSFAELALALRGGKGRRCRLG